MSMGDRGDTTSIVSCLLKNMKATDYIPKVFRSKPTVPLHVS